MMSAARAVGAMMSRQPNYAERRQAREKRIVGIVNGYKKSYEAVSESISQKEQEPVGNTPWPITNKKREIEALQANRNSLRAEYIALTKPVVKERASEARRILGKADGLGAEQKRELFDNNDNYARLFTLSQNITPRIDGWEEREDSVPSADEWKANEAVMQRVYDAVKAQNNR